MDILRFTSETARRRTEGQRNDLHAWLQENGRIPRDKDGSPDPSDGTLTFLDSPDSCEPPNPDVSITRDEATKQIGYAVMPNLGAPKDRRRVERRTLQMDHVPTPFPASLAEFVVTV